MSLQPGARLGPYEVLSALGAGGMGEVWRARDGRLARAVALKVLPEAFVADPERLARFEREAKVLASLNHPHIGGIHGLEEADGVKALVLELVEGPTLADRIARGAIPIDEALPIARQIAEALEAAHEQGIIHRDLKPANIKVKADGTVKVLDFGLAKALEPQVASAAGADLSHSPTLTLGAATQMGVILGTAAYMAPEQARGRPVDKRADIWAFGCVLYEMLTGKRAFEGDDVSDLLVAVLRAEPDWNALPSATPERLRSLLRACLQRELKRRLRDVGDLRLVLEGAFEPAPPQPVPPAQPFRWLAAGVLLGVLVCGTLIWLLAPPVSPRPALMRFALAAPPDTQMGVWGNPSMALSPNGRTFTFVASRGGLAQLYRRDLDRLESAPIPGTEGAMYPFFSPDGAWVGFFTTETLKKVPLDGGPPVPLSSISSMPLGGSWADDGSVVFATFTPPNLWRVPASGGEPVAIARGQQETDTAYSWPHVLPGARTAVAMVWRPTDDQWQIATVSLKTGETRALGPGSFPRYAATGHLVYWRDLSIWALPFDATRVESSGAPVPVVVGVEADEVGSAAFAIAERGSLVYAPGTRQTELTWVDRRGARERLPVDVSSYFDPSLSPDGRRLALVKPQESNQDVWIYDIPADTWFRLTTQPGWDGAPIWDPGGHITFGERSQKEFSLLRATIGTAGSVEKLVGGSAVKFPSSWSPDGRNLAYIESTGTAWDIWMLDETREARPFLQAAFNETDPVFSPDGQYLAYTSDESGDREVYVVAFPEGGGKQPISQHGGFWPVWARNGQRLFYRTESHVMSVEVRGDGEFGVPEPLFEAPVLGGVMRGYDVAPDGERLIVIQKLAGRSEIGFELVLNWFEELKRLAPAN